MSDHGPIRVFCRECNAAPVYSDGDREICDSCVKHLVREDELLRALDQHEFYEPGNPMNYGEIQNTLVSKGWSDWHVASTLHTLRLKKLVDQGHRRGDVDYFFPSSKHHYCITAKGTAQVNEREGFSRAPLSEGKK